jgi:predicted nucleic acid-binding protein
VCAESLADLLLHHELVTSEFILGELGRKLVDEFRFPECEAGQVAAFLHRVAIEPAELPSDLCRDPTDIPILGTAVGGECALLISVDRDLLDMRRINEIPIIRPAEYYRRATEDGWVAACDPIATVMSVSYRAAKR